MVFLQGRNARVAETHQRKRKDSPNKTVYLPGGLAPAPANASGGLPGLRPGGRRLMALTAAAVDVEVKISAADETSAAAAAEKIITAAQTGALAVALRNAGLIAAADVTVVLKQLEKEEKGVVLGDLAVLGISIGGFMICIMAFAAYYRRRTALTRLEQVEFGNIMH